MACPGLDAPHEWDGGAVLFNTPFSSGYPRFWLTNMQNLYGLPDSEVESGVPHSGQIGERWDSQVLDGKSLPWTGEIEVTSRAEFDAAIAELHAAFSDRRTPKTMRSAPGEERERVWQAVPIGLSVDETWPAQGLKRVPSPYVREFALDLRMLDPRFYYVEEQNEIDAWTATEARVTCLNEGSAPTDPVIVVTGPATSVTVANDTDDRQLVIPTTLLGPGTSETLTIDFARRLITHMTLGDVTGLLDEEDSNWWDRGIYGLDPGTQDVVLTGTGMNASTTLEVIWTSADW